MRKRFTRSLVVLAVVGLLSGLSATPASASHEDVCTPGVAPGSITVAGITIDRPGVSRRCVDLPDPSTLPGAYTYQDEFGAHHIVVYNTGTQTSICMFGVDGGCTVWLDTQ